MKCTVEGSAVGEYTPHDYLEIRPYYNAILALAATVEM